MAHTSLGETNREREEEKRRKRRSGGNRAVNPVQAAQGAEGSQGTTLGDNSGTGVVSGVLNNIRPITANLRNLPLGPIRSGLGILTSAAESTGIIDPEEVETPDSGDVPISDLILSETSSAIKTATQELKDESAEDLANTTELGAINDPNTIRGASRVDLGGVSPLQLQATSRANPSGTGATFEFDDGTGSVSTESDLGAARIANGAGIRGAQVGTFNTNNLIASNRADEAQRVIREGRASGRSPQDILDQVRSIRNRPTRLGGQGNTLQDQLDRVDQLEESGALNPAFAQSRRNRINKQVTARQAAQGDLSISQFEAQTKRAKATADSLAKTNKSALERTNAINKLLSEGQTSLSVVVNQFGIDGLNASSKALALKGQLVQDLRDFRDDPQQLRDLGEQFLEDLGLPTTDLQLVQQFVQG